MKTTEDTAPGPGELIDEWTPIKNGELPDIDVDRTVLLCHPDWDEPVWPGYLDEEHDEEGIEGPWRWVEGSLCKPQPTHFRDFPELPNPQN